ncbi:uncharacterized protein [Typha angustifolia]|uniref:uncharacterized protein n=1 Tax=Typha angustifolia TaxID=59011 RepID=UPI003C300E2F
MSSLINREAVTAAVSALLTWMRSRSKTRKPQLLLDDDDDLLYLVISLKRIPSSSRTNPFLLPLPHPLFSSSSSSTSVFLIADDRPSSSPSPSPSVALDLARSFNLPISEVVGISDLRTDYRPFESRRKLCGSHDLFVADRRVIPLLPRLLGKSFFRKKKIPLPLDLSRPGWPQQLQRCLNSTFLYLRSGTCSGIKVGRLSMEIDQIVDNFMAVVEEAVARVPKKWGNVRSLHIKAMDSVALPIYQAVPEVGLKIDVPQKGGLDVEDKNVKGEKKKKKEKKEKKKNGKMDQVMRYVDGGCLVGKEESEVDGEEEMENKRKRAKKDVPEIGDGKEEKRNKKKKKEEGMKDADTDSNIEDDVTGEGVGDELDEEDKAMNEKNKKKSKVGNIKKRKDGQGKEIALLHSTGHEMKNKSKTKKVGDKQVQKTKRSKVRT